VAAGGGRERAAMLAAAERWTGKIEAEGAPWAAPVVSVSRAAIAELRGESQSVVTLLETAIAGFDKAEMGLYAAVARRRLGQTIGGESGAALVRAADLWMTDQRIKSPVAMSRLLAPGFADGAGVTILSGDGNLPAG
jgi:hypothetical protein